MATIVDLFVTVTCKPIHGQLLAVQGSCQQLFGYRCAQSQNQCQL
jgi:hypothetical protein